jgi:hypothetical protein
LVVQVAHIYPFSILHMPPSVNFVPTFWQFLAIFWSVDRVKSWESQVFEEDFENGIESCANLICLSVEVHDSWAKGAFALKPPALTNDRTSLTLQFFWMPVYEPRASVSIPQVPKPLEGLTSHGSFELFDFSTRSFIQSGHQVTLETENPETMPLPSVALLEMQWVLQRLTAMSAAAEPVDYLWQNDDDAEALQTRSLYDAVDDWQLDFVGNSSGDSPNTSDQIYTPSPITARSTAYNPAATPTKSGTSNPKKFGTANDLLITTT